MMRPVTELFNGGLVTARVGAMLNSGELQRADDCFYREKDPAIWRAPGRTALTSTAIGADIRGIRHLSFDGNFTEQILMLGRRTDGTPTWTSGQNPTTPDTHLYSTDFTAITGLAPTEVGGQGRWVGTVTSTAFDANLVIASCTISAGTAVTGSSIFGNVVVGMVVSGTGITAGTRVSAIQDNSNITLDTSATSGTVTLTFTQYPFLATAVGARVIGTSIGSNIYITAVSNQDGTTGHYKTATLSAAPSGGNGVYTPVFTCGTAVGFGNLGTEILDAIQFNARKYFVWDGTTSALRAVEWADRSSVAATQPALSARPVGLKPVIVAPTLALNTGQSTGWNLVKGAGTYWFLITEIYSPNGDIATALKDPVQKLQIVESAYLGVNPATDADTGSQGGAGLPISKAIVTPASDTITITFPAVQNNGEGGYVATHWGIYIYGPSTDLPSLALLRRCSTVAMTTYAAGQTYTLTDSTLTQLQYPTAFAAATGYALPFSHVDHMTGTVDLDYGSVQTGGTHWPVYLDGASRLTTFGFSTAGNYVAKVPIGIQVVVNSRSTSISGLWIKLMATASGRQTGTLVRGVPNIQSGIAFGGPMDLLGVAWTNTDTSTLAVELGIVKQGFNNRLDVYDVYIKIWYTSVNVDFNGPAYRVVTYRDQVGTTVSDPARLLPPVCTTGDFFQGCLVLNDLSQINTLRYSLPDDPEAFPKPYRLTFNTRKRDRITFIRSFNGILFVGLENTVKRVMYLPRETDTDMTSGLAHEDIATDHGVPGPFCATLFDMPGKGVFMAYASTSGMFISNGIWTLPLNVDLDWENTVKIGALSTAVLRNYSRQKLLALYYCPAGATHSRNTRVMYFSYQADKIKGMFQLPAVGPSVVSARSACEAYLNGISYILTGQETDGLVYVEDSGLTVPAGYRVTNTATASTQGDGKATVQDVQIIPIIRTRKIYSAGMDRDVFGDKVYLMFSPYGTNSTLVALCQLTAGSTDVTQASAGFVADYSGYRVKGTGIDPGTIQKAFVNSGDITLSRAANTSGGVTLTFDTGTIGIGIRGSGLGEATKGLSTDYVSTLAGDLVSIVNSNIRRGFELQIEKVPLTFDSNGDTLTWADLGTNMRLHQITYMVSESGYPDTNRNTT
jgi:hypothetical protein